MSNAKVRLLPPKFILCPSSDLIVLIARMLDALITINDTRPDESGSTSSSSLHPSNLTRFHSRTPPSISVYSYLARLARYSSLENAVLLSAIYYIDLLTAVYPSFLLNSLTVHRFLLTATTVGSKGLCDSFCTNSHYAKVGGIHANELDILEREFLTKVNYRVLPREFNIDKCTREKQIAENTGRKNSIDTLVDNKNLSQDPDEEKVKLERLQHPELCPNAGYDVLELYYHKMVALVGTDIHRDDVQLTESFIYQMTTTVQSSQTSEQSPDLIKTDFDTLPNEDYKKQVKLLLQGISQCQSEVRVPRHQLHTRVQKRSSDVQVPPARVPQVGIPKEQVQPPRPHPREHPQVSQLRTDEGGHVVPSSRNVNNYGNASGQPPLVPPSPLKRPIDPEIDQSPRGGRKRNASHSG